MSWTPSPDEIDAPDDVGVGSGGSDASHWASLVVPSSTADSVAVELPALVPVENLTSKNQRFECVPLNARLFAHACLAKQENDKLLAAGHWRAPNGKLRRRGMKTNGLAQQAARGAARANAPCADCELGREVERKVGGTS